MTFFATTLTTSTTAQPLLVNKPAIERVTQILVKVRSMGAGGATYAAIGGEDSQEIRLTGVGDYWSIDTPAGKRYVDVRPIRVVSDAAGVVLEIIGDKFNG